MLLKTFKSQRLVNGCSVVNDVDVPAKDKGSVPHTRLAPGIHVVQIHTGKNSHTLLGFKPRDKG